MGIGYCSVSNTVEYPDTTWNLWRPDEQGPHRCPDRHVDHRAARAVCDLVEGLGGKIEGLVFVVELEFLPGRSKLEGYDVRSLIKYQS